MIPAGLKASDDRGHLPPPRSYLLKYIHAVSANRTIAMIQREESLISVFLAMSRILIPMSLLQ
jgi:hypothetical protein